MNARLLVALVFVPTLALAEDLNAIFKKVGELYAAGKYPAALTELEWARKELEKENLKKLQALLPDSIEGFTGEPVESGSGLGITNIERSYRGGSGASMKVSVTGFGGAAGGALGGLAALGQMAAMMGNLPGMEAFRVGTLTGSMRVDQQQKEVEATVTLSGGSLFIVKLDNSTDGETVKKIAAALAPSINTYLQG